MNRGARNPVLSLICPACHHEGLRRDGATKRLANGEAKDRYRCLGCGKRTQAPIDPNGDNREARPMSRAKYYKYFGCPFGGDADIPELVGCKFTIKEYAELRGVSRNTANNLLKRYCHVGFYDPIPSDGTYGLSIPVYHDGITPQKLHFHKSVTTKAWR